MNNNTFASDSLRIDLTPLLGDFGDFHVSSSYGIVQEVTEVLEARLFKTKQPENIHGGILLKYCLLKSNGFQVYETGKHLKRLHEVMGEGFLRTSEKGHHHRIPAKPLQSGNNERGNHALQLGPLKS